MAGASHVMGWGDGCQELQLVMTCEVDGQEHHMGWGGRLMVKSIYGMEGRWPGASHGNVVGH